MRSKNNLQSGMSVFFFLFLILLVTLGVLFVVTKNLTVDSARQYLIDVLSKETPVPTPTTTPIPLDVNLVTPGEGQSIVSPVTVVGTINKTWTFESNFKIEILDSQKQVIATSPVAAKFISATSDFGTFTISIPFTKTTNSGFIVIKNDNPSGLPEKEKSFKIPVNFQ